MKHRTAKGPRRDLGAIVRRLRRSRRLSLRKLALAVGFSPSFISQLERNKVSPSISSLERLATGLGVTLGDFFSEESSAITVVRRAERQRLTSGWSRARIETLGGTRGQRLEPVLVTIAPGGQSGKRSHPHPSERFVFVVDGTIELTLADVVHTMRRGDSIVIPPAVPHHWENRSQKPTSLVIVSVRPD